MTKVALIGYGYLGKAYHKVFPNAVVYDEPRIIEMAPRFHGEPQPDLPTRRAAVNMCDIAIVAVPTDPLDDGSLDMSIVEDVVGWLETPLILIKSALTPGTTDRLRALTNKQIAVSVEFIGMGNYFTPPHKYPDPHDPAKHDLLIVGGQLDVATACANILWAKMSPDIHIHLMSAREAEICKLVENAWGAMKVTWANCLYNLVEKAEGNPIRVHQAWSADGRVDAMHTRVVPGKRGWKSHCYDKDIPALIAYAAEIGANDMARMVNVVQSLNDYHLEQND